MSEQPNNLTSRIVVSNISGIEILHSDFSYTSKEELLKLMDLHSKVINDRYPKKTFILLNVKKVPLTNNTIEACKKMVISNQHTNSVTALYDANSMTSVLLKTLGSFNNNKLKAFRTKEKALEYLLDEYQKTNQ